MELNIHHLQHLSVGIGGFEDPGGYSGVHAAVIAAEKNLLNQCQVVICRFNVGDVIENLAKSEAASRELEEDLKESLRGNIALPTVKLATSAG